MCGITGVFDLREQRTINRDVLARINDMQWHRGPDEAGLHIEPGLGLGHRRLSIIDIAAGQQPLANHATAKHPYSFYVLTRWVVFLTSCCGLWLGARLFWPSFAPAYITVGLVFNPILPFHFHRSAWHTLDRPRRAVLALGP